MLPVIVRFVIPRITTKKDRNRSPDKVEPHRSSKPESQKQQAEKYLSNVKSWNHEYNSAVRRYHDTVSRYKHDLRRKQENFWLALRGTDLEQETTSIFQ